MDIVCRVVYGYAFGGSSEMLYPSISMPLTKDSLGIIGGISLENCKGR